ncbi:MAG: TauD/TfdA family dioxygenase [Gammaproteobacteria bacterium]|nr:TauD/TfdA family dioxygenase [Gammaproteobacteria bacterium]MYB37675.1 TauD/TfdA family dioxygenase [Gammaproteobacteria bacterium]
MPITVTPTDATLGAVVTDVDLAQLDDATWEEIHAAFLTYGVLIFPGQNLTEEAQGAFALRFGNIEKLTPKQDKPTLQFSNQKPDGTTAQPSDPGYPLMRGNEGWHTDSTYMPLAAKAAMLMALVVPPEGGETEFADMRAAYDALSPQMQEKLEGLSAHHSLYHSQSKAGYTHKTDHLYGFHDKGAPRRPVIKTHPETGRKSIYTGRHAYGIVGMAPEESEALLDALMEDACQPPRTYRHSWQVGDLVVWDNRCLMHRARPYDTSHPRVLRASRIAGEPETELAPTYPDPRAEAYHPTTSNESALATA